MSEPTSLTSDLVKIRLKHRDWEVEISCVENKIKQVVENVLSSIDTSNTDQDFNSQFIELKKEIDSIKIQIGLFRPNHMPMINAIDSSQKMIKRVTTCRGILETLWYEGFFGTERLLGEVHEELSRRGYNYDRTAVSHSLTDMVRESILSREGTMRNYRYIQKRPCTELTL